MQIVILILGLAAIIKSADVLIDSSSKIAQKYGVSSFVIAITVIAFGTSAPELAVGIVSGINHTNQLTLGNIVGSSLSNIALIVGISAIILPLGIKDRVVKREIPMLILVQSILTFMLLYDGILTKIEGCILLLAFILFMLYIWLDTKKSMEIRIDVEINEVSKENKNENEKENNTRIIKLWIYSILSLIGLFIGGKMTVDSSVKIAKSFGLDETLIGLTVIALATTMPELITSIVAVSKKEPDIVLGNCIGSNIFNILFVLGCSSVIHPIKVVNGLWIDIVVMLTLTMFVFITSLIIKKIHRSTGFLLLLCYISYITYKVVIVLA